jgi:probable rRNA maturation factor
MRIIYNQDLFTISSTLKRTPSIDGVLFNKLKDKILGKKYDLSVVFIGKKRMRKLNCNHRNKDYPTDILSFTIEKDSGEIFIFPEKAKQKAKEFDRKFSNYLYFLFIHGLTHLKGFEHGSRMEYEEAKVRSLFNI